MSYVVSLPTKILSSSLVFESLCTSFLLLVTVVNESSFESAESEGGVSSRLQPFARLLLSFSFRPKTTREKFGWKIRMILY